LNSSTDQDQIKVATEIIREENLALKKSKRNKYLILLIGALIVYPLFLSKANYWKEKAAEYEEMKQEEILKYNIDTTKIKFHSTYEAFRKHAQKRIEMQYYIMALITLFFLYRIYRIRNG
jgi:hypothetical protein